MIFFLLSSQLVFFVFWAHSQNSVLFYSKFVLLVFQFVKRLTHSDIKKQLFDFLKLCVSFNGNFYLMLKKVTP